MVPRFLMLNRQPVIISHHGKPTAKSIITAKPIMASLAAKAVLPSPGDAGAGSPTTMKIMDPAAKARAWGRRAWDHSLTAAPLTPE